MSRVDLITMSVFLVFAVAFVLAHVALSVLPGLTGKIVVIFAALLAALGAWVLLMSEP